MSFELVAYGTLKLSLNESIKALILKSAPDYRLDEDKLDDAVAEVLQGERKIQVQLLLKIISLTDAMEGVDIYRARVLNTAAFYIRDLIAATYKYASPSGSNFYNALTTSLKLSKGNQPNRNDLFDMCGAFLEFLCTHVYVNGDPRKGYLETQPFAIANYKVEDTIKDLSSRKERLFNELVDAANELHIKSSASQVSSTGIFRKSHREEKQPADSTSSSAEKVVKKSPSPSTV